MPNCIFCQIISHKIPAHIIHEDDYCLAFLDIFPSTDGHTLIVPKEHHQDLHDLPSENAKHLHSIAQKISQTLIQKLNYTGTTLMQNNGSCQDVPHYHLHVIGRNKNHTLTIKNLPKPDNTPEYLTLIKNKLKELT